MTKLLLSFLIFLFLGKPSNAQTDSLNQNFTHLGLFDNDTLEDTLTIIENGIIIKYGNLEEDFIDWVYWVEEESIPNKKNKFISLPIQNSSLVVKAEVDKEISSPNDNFIPSHAKIIANNLKNLNIKLYHDLVLLDLGDVYYCLVIINQDVYIINLGV